MLLRNPGVTAFRIDELMEKPQYFGFHRSAKSMKNIYSLKGGRSAQSDRLVTVQSKWYFGSASVMGAVAASSASAETVQITQSNNQINLNAGVLQDTLKEDLTGDTVDDLGLGTITFNYSDSYDVRLFNNGILIASAGAFTDSGPWNYGVMIKDVFDSRGASGFDESGFYNIVFTDARINGGAQTEALMEIRAVNFDTDHHAVQLLRLVFDDASTTRPTNAVVGGTNTEWAAPPSANPSTAADRVRLTKAISKEKKKLRRAKSSGKSAKVKKIKKKIKKLSKRLAAL